MRTEENVFRFLDRIRANGKEIPSLRAIRSEVGGGSLSTISKAVNDWKVANQSSTADPHTLPVTLSEEQLKLLGDSIWNAFRPLLAAKITNLKAEMQTTCQKLKDELLEAQTELQKYRAQVVAYEEQVHDLKMELEVAKREQAKAEGAYEALKTFTADK